MNEPTSQPKTLCVFSFLNFVFFLLVIVWVLRRVNAISYFILVFSHGKSAVVYIAETTQLSKQALLLVNWASGPANSSKSSIRISTRLLPYKMNFGNCTEKYVELSIMHEICDSRNICKSCLPSSVLFSLSVAAFQINGYFEPLKNTIHCRLSQTVSHLYTVNCVSQNSTVGVFKSLIQKYFLPPCLMFPPSEISGERTFLGFRPQSANACTGLISWLVSLQIAVLLIELWVPEASL